MILYTCPFRKTAGSLPAPLAHPCGRAAAALDKAGHDYELREVKGGKLMLWTLPSRGTDREEIERLSGQRSVPILVLDDGEVLVGSGAIAGWASEHRLPAAAG